MDRVPVDSSNLASVGYNEDSQVLEVEFLNGSVYRYFAVPRSVHDGLMSATSHGGYLDQFVKKAGYRYEKLG